MYKKAGNQDKAPKVFASMAERGSLRLLTIPLRPLKVTIKKFLRAMTRCKDLVFNLIVSYALLIKAYGRARREEAALSVFEEMLDAGVRSTFSVSNNYVLLLLAEDSKK